MILALAASAASAAAGTSTNGYRSSCAPAHARVVAADAQAQVYSAKQPYLNAETHRPLGEIKVYRGCVNGNKHSVFVGPGPSQCSSSGCSQGSERITLAGSVVAFERSATTEDPLGGSAEWLVVVRDMRSGHLLRSVPTGDPSPPSPGFVGAGPTAMIVVKSDGAVAWTVDTNRDRDRYQVHTADKSGSRLLATGSDINPHSLALGGSVLYWTQGGKPFSSVLD